MQLLKMAIFPIHPLKKINISIWLNLKLDWLMGKNPFIQVSSKELMLNVRKQSLVKVVNIELINS